jgi:hypothetical protein
MVEIVVFLEGITADDSNPATFDRSNVFRQAFHQLLSQAIPEDSNISLIIESSGGWRAAAKAFLRKKQKDNQTALLIIDMEGSKTLKKDRFTETFKDVEGTLNDKKEAVFFMIQKMESWILSQPKIIEDFAIDNNFNRKIESPISEHQFLRVHPEDIENPDGKLETLFKQYFQEKTEKRGKIKDKAASYHKTKVAPHLIMKLNFEELAQKFEDAKSLKEKLESLFKTTLVDEFKTEYVEDKEILLHTTLKKK